MSSFGSTLRRKRRAAGISQRKLAERAGVDFSYISKLENDRIPAPAAETAIRFAQIIGCPPEELLSAAKKIPARLSDAVSNKPAALRFLKEASRLKLTEAEWEELTGSLENLRPDLKGGPG